MAGLMNFESSREIERKRNEIREGRHKILEKAKDKYEKEERRKELAKQRGEGTWMLSSINERLTNEEQSMKKSESKKKKKEKKKKKHKEKKKKKRKDSSSSSDSSDEEEDQPQWIEKSATLKKPDISAPVIKGPQMQRDDWMNAPLDIFPTVSRKDLIDKKNKEKEEIAKQKEMMEKPGMHAKELNPYWKDGGSGLPEERPATSQRAGPAAASLGDSGLEWLQRSYKRCVEQAKEDGRTLEEVAAERYGSLEKLQGMIRDAEAALGKGQGRNDRGGGSSDRRGAMRKGFMRPTDSHSSDYKQTNRQRSRSRSRSPSGHSRGSRNRSRERDRRRSRSRERYRRSRSRSPRRDRSRSRSRERRRERSRSRDRYRQRSRSPRGKPLSGSSSLRGKFMKPGDIDESGRKSGRSGSESSGQPAWRKKEFQKPVEREKTRNVSENSERDLSEKKSRDREEKSRRRRSPSESSSSDSSSSEDSDSSSSDKGQGRGQKSAPREPEVRILTEKEMNDLGAKILKAEIMGNTAQAEKLKAQLEAAQEAKKKAPAGGGGEMKRRGTEDEGEDFVVLTRTDRSGLARPVPESEYPTESGGKRRRKKQRVETHTGKQGERTKYFDDDDKFDLKTLVEREKLGTAEDQNQMFARLAGRAAEKTDDDFQVDDVFVNKASHKQSESIQEQRDRAQAVFEHKKMASALGKCNYCFDKVPKHLIVAIGTKAYLCLPNYKSLTEGHCLIVPMQHVAASTALDEDVWSEMQVFRKCLTKMFTERDEDVVFMETSMRLKHFPHLCIECVPMDKEVGDLAPIYFKKAIQDSETEWSQNKKVVDLSQKDIRHAVPKGFPYFAVDFGYQGGFAHVIEDEQKFPNYFGKEIIGGMIDAEHRLWRKPMKENFDDQRRKVMKFAEMWKPYDWTQNIAKKMESSSDSDSD